MSVLPPLNLNCLLGLLDFDAVDRFRDEFPHLYLPHDAGIGLRNPSVSNVFKKVAIKLIVQHWLTANDLYNITVLNDELRRKEDGLYNAVRKGYGLVNEHESQLDQVDPAFDRSKDKFERKAREEAESYEDFDPDEDGDMHIARIEIIGLAEFAVDGKKQEIMVRSFVSLRRVLNEGLKDISDRWRELKKSPWQDEIQLKGEADYVHLLRQLETNFPDRGISVFTKKSGILYQLNSLRNDVEHEERKYKSDRHSTENLIGCFSEIKALMECMEQIDKEEMVTWLY